MNKNIAREASKGGKARAKKLTKQQRRDSALKANAARWTRYKDLLCKGTEK